MQHHDSFHGLMSRLRRGDDAAAAVVFNRFAHRLIGLARQQLDGLTRVKVDAEDVLQSVFRSFFLRHAGEAFDLGGWDSLWGLLTTITVRKCWRKGRYFRQERRDVRREISLDAVSRDAATDWNDAAEPTPDQAALLAEIVQQLLTDQEPRDRQIIMLTLQGWTTEEVSARVGCTQRTVQRVLQRLRGRLEQMSEDGEGPAPSPPVEGGGS